jgi:hypothetical protein
MFIVAFVGFTRKMDFIPRTRSAWILRPASWGSIGVAVTEIEILTGCFGPIHAPNILAMKRM